jgi:hypothetical protein
MKILSEDETAFVLEAQIVFKNNLFYSKVKIDKSTGVCLSYLMGYC